MVWEQLFESLVACHSVCKFLLKLYIVFNRIVSNGIVVKVMKLNITLINCILTLLFSSELVIPAFKRLLCFLKQFVKPVLFCVFLWFLDWNEVKNWFFFKWNISPLHDMGFFCCQVPNGFKLSFEVFILIWNGLVFSIFHPVGSEKISKTRIHGYAINRIVWITVRSPRALICTWSRKCIDFFMLR